jgi:D-lactate dehydrogenase
MKENAMIINTGRGALIETKAVVNALKKKKLGGLAIGNYVNLQLDVYE